MKEPYGEGLASRTGPESCAGTREGTGEALTGVHTCQPLSCENFSFGVVGPLVSIRVKRQEIFLDTDERDEHGWMEQG